MHLTLLLFQFLPVYLTMNLLMFFHVHRVQTLFLNLPVYQTINLLKFFSTHLTLFLFQFFPVYLLSTMSEWILGLTYTSLAASFYYELCVLEITSHRVRHVKCEQNQKSICEVDSEDSDESSWSDGDVWTSAPSSAPKPT